MEHQSIIKVDLSCVVILLIQVEIHSHTKSTLRKKSIAIWWSYKRGPIFKGSGILSMTNCLYEVSFSITYLVLNSPCFAWHPYENPLDSMFFSYPDYLYTTSQTVCAFVSLENVLILWIKIFFLSECTISMVQGDKSIYLIFLFSIEWRKGGIALLLLVSPSRHWYRPPVTGIALQHPIWM